MIANRALAALAAAVLTAVGPCGQAWQVATAMTPPPDGAVLTWEIPTDPATMPRAPLVPEITPEMEDLVNAVSPGLVSVYSYRNGTAFSSGTGIVLTSRGLVVTNAHVTQNGDRFLAVANGFSQTYRSVLVGVDPSHDLALLQMQDAANLYVTPRGDSDRVKIGDRVASLGYAYAQGRVWIGDGPVTRLGLTTHPTGPSPTRVLTGMIEAHSSSLPGESGGPMVTTDGVVIGINQAGCCWDTRTATDYSYAIPINTAMRAVNQILSSK